MKDRRIEWLLFPIVFGVLFFSITMISFFGMYPNKDSNYWFAYWFGWSIFVSIVPLLISLACTFVGYAPKVGRIIVYSFIVCVGAQVVWILTDNLKYNFIINEIAITLLSFIVIGSHYLHIFRIKHNKQSPFHWLDVLLIRLKQLDNYPGTYFGLINFSWAFLMALVPLSVIPGFVLLNVLQSHYQSPIHSSKVVMMLFLLLFLIVGFLYYYYHNKRTIKRQFSRSRFNWFCIIEYILINNVIFNFVLDPYIVIDWKLGQIIFPLFCTGFYSSLVVLFLGVIDDAIFYLRKDFAT